jgi:hypothetical protein
MVPSIVLAVGMRGDGPGYVESMLLIRRILRFTDIHYNNGGGMKIAIIMR